jgi:hypothetical protein
MKYVIMKNGDLILKLGRFRKDEKTDYVHDEYYSPLSKSWENDNSLYSNLLDGLLQEITETEANQFIATQFSRERQAA